MARYFFNVRDGFSVDDKIGTELSDVKSAKRQALRVMSAFMSNTLYDPDDNDWRMVVKDNEGKVLFVLRPIFSPI